MNAEHDLSAELFSPIGESWFGATPDSYLMFALEMLAWSEEHFGRVADLMSRVAEVIGRRGASSDPAKRVSKLFAAGINFTDASDQVRLGALERLVRTRGQTGWRVLCEAYPTDRGFVVETPGPIWRPWGAGGPQRSSRPDVLAYAVEMERLLVENVGSDPERWLGLMDLFWYVTDDGRAELARLLGQRVLDMVGSAGALELWDELRKKISWFRMHEDNENAVSLDCMGMLEGAYGALEPAELVARYAWKFDYWPLGYEENVLDFDHQSRATVMREWRAAAIKEVHENGGETAVWSLVGEVRDPRLMGQPVWDGLGEETAVALVSSHLGSENESHRVFSRSVLSELYWVWGWARLDAVLAWVLDDGRNAAAVADVFLAASGVEDTWRRLEAQSARVQDAYWEGVGRWEVRPMLTEELAFASGQLLRVGRVMEAIGLLAHSDVAMDENCADVASRALEMEGRSSVGSGIGYRADAGDCFSIAQLLGRLDEIPGVTDEEIALLEMPYVGALYGFRRDFKIYREVESNPSVFANLVALTVSGIEEVDNGGSAVDSTGAGRRYAYGVLLEMENMPGASPDGYVESAVLIDWVNEVRRICSTLGCLSVADRHIGGVLARSPKGTDGVWPCEAVRDILDDCLSTDLERGFSFGVRGLRGMTSRGLFDGGGQERSLAGEYGKNADDLLARWPRTASLLRGLAQHYGWDARWHDDRAQWLDHSAL